MRREGDRGCVTFRLSFVQRLLYPRLGLGPDLPRGRRVYLCLQDHTKLDEGRFGNEAGSR